MAAVLLDRDRSLTLEAGTGGLVAERVTGAPAAADRVQALVMPVGVAVRRLGV